MIIKGKWERDALRPGMRFFLESHPQKVADLGSDFGLARWIAKHHGLTAILVPDSKKVAHFLSSDFGLVGLQNTLA